MNILLINQYYPPDRSATALVATSTAEALARAGHAVTVLAGRASYNPETRHQWHPWCQEQAGRVTIERVGSLSRSRLGIRRRVLNYLSYVVLATFRAFCHRVNVVMAMTDPPIAGLVAATIAKLRRLPFVYSIQDLHPDMALAAGMIARGPLTDFWEKLHRWALRQADLILTLGEDMRSKVIAKNISEYQVQVIRHGAELMGPIPAATDPVVQEIRSGFKFTLVHAGNIGFYGAWKTLVDSARSLEDHGVGLLFVGSGAAEEYVRKEASVCRNVRFLPFRPIEQLPHVMAAGDMQIVTVKSGLEGLVVPSKFYTAIAAGRPVLIIADKASDAARLVQAHECGLVVPPDDVKAVKNALLRVMSNSIELSVMSRNAFALAYELNRTEQFNRIVTTIESTIKSVLSG